MRCKRCDWFLALEGDYCEKCRQRLADYKQRSRDKALGRDPVAEHKSYIEKLAEDGCVAAQVWLAARMMRVERYEADVERGWPIRFLREAA